MGNNQKIDGLILQTSDLLPGDVLLYRPRKPNLIQKKISSATNSPYTHASIYIGQNNVAESGVPFGVRKTGLVDAIQDAQCVAVLRTPCGFGGHRPQKLNEFVVSILENRKLYDFAAALKFEKNSAAYFDGQLDFIRKNYGKFTSPEEFIQQRFFCSAFVVACYAVVGIIDKTAQVAYQPDFFSPGHLYEDPTFGWLLGYLIPKDGSIPEDDPILSMATLWRDCMEAEWW